MKRFYYLFLSLLLVVSCSKDDIDNQDNMAFSSDAECVGPQKVGTGDFLETNINIPGETSDDKFDFVANIYGKVHRASEDVDEDGNHYFQLGFIVTENSQNPGFVYLKLRPADANGVAKWEKLNPCRKSMISGFWDTLSKNNSKDAFILQQGTERHKVYLFYNNGKKYKQFRVDNGEVLKAANNRVRTLPPGFTGQRLFFHNSNRADFPANWLGLKGKKLYNFGSNLNATPELIPVRQNGFGGADLNRNIKRIRGYWPHNNQRIQIEKDNGTIHTLQKERRDGVNFYKT